mmetsp:Transcript_36980/g.99650  ORF Transcript_36980/g.99650 Transcript_36980/m.99650 type:complete len:331 (-) Transcript_36980:73-1065(-)|eukprot:CAMPEP_0119539446 /NCGR_PEP_ID=MMETSP1344-20130328/51598_1 /TAXON_ID=236787 /ORGANISM="Florenciella parvula, Strain CCMP2471" /LENGTH=330 /DNA_ID=CAMNT_0007582749 /DNA_START=173 /DNA_END=1165 /DNA_ORIENTATION=-
MASETRAPGLMSLSAAQSAEDEAASASSASAPSDRKRARDDSNSTNSDEPAANKPKAGPFSWHRPDSWTGRVAPLSVPAEGRVHLLPFLLPTQICDSDNPTIIQLARSIVPRGSGPKLAAEIVRDWIRRNIRYSLDDKRSRASETLAKREGMCSNKANLQISLLRATGVACGYRLVHVTKECFRSDKMLPELFEKIHEPTVHCFCAVYLPDIDEEGLPKMTGSFYNYDATERVREANEEHVFLHEESESGETRYQDRWLRGPFGPPQANLDHLLLMRPSQRWNLAKNLFERQNELYRKEHKPQRRHSNPENGTASEGKEKENDGSASDSA